MLKMVKETFNDYVKTDNFKITYPNDYIEWSLSNLYSDIVANDLKEFNQERSFKLLNESEVDYVLDMMETRYKDFKKTEMIKPFYLKATLTYQQLCEHIGLSGVQTDHQLENFKQIDIDTTIKLLKKLKRLFYNRAVIVAVLKDIKERELFVSLITNKTRELLSSGNITDINLQSVSALRDHIKVIYELDQRIYGGLKNLYSEGLLFGADVQKGKMIFKFSNRDYFHHIAQDTGTFIKLYFH